jgi:uncharacterized protein YigA (DUF484 family)
MTADEVAAYLAAHPDFFARHPELLSSLQLPHPQNGQAVSLIERQSQVQRERIRALEAKLATLIRHGEDNDVIADRLVQWARALLLTDDPARLPQVAVDELQRIFAVPHGAVRVWRIAPPYAQLPCAQPVSDDVRRLAASMVAPFCGANVGFEAAMWMAAEEPGSIRSLALLPLRIGAEPDAFGLLVLGSPDRDRFQIAMGTTFLARMAELASAALARLRGD